jgi:hypothetical protein
MLYSRIKNLSRTKVWLIGNKRRRFNVYFKQPSRTYNKRNHLEPVYKLQLNPISLRILV